MIFILLGTMFGLLLLVSCSSSESSATLPDVPNKNVSKENTGHQLLGLWEFVADPEAGTLEYHALRSQEMHLNVLPFLEPVPLLYLTLESDIIYDVINNTLQVDVGLTHPY
jgi:hypothetical protein